MGFCWFIILFILIGQPIILLFQGHEEMALNYTVLSLLGVPIFWLLLNLLFGISATLSLTPYLMAASIMYWLWFLILA